MVTRYKDSSICEISTKNVFICYIIIQTKLKIDINLNIIITALINDKKSV